MEEDRCFDSLSVEQSADWIERWNTVVEVEKTGQESERIEREEQNDSASKKRDYLHCRQNDSVEEID